MVTAHFTDEAAHSNYLDFLATTNFHWWDQGYKLIRDVNIFSDAIPALKVSDDEKA